MQFCHSDIEINPSKIGFIKFIVEGYDGLATVSTVDRTSGHIRFFYPESRNDELHHLLENLVPALQTTPDSK